MIITQNQVSINKCYWAILLLRQHYINIMEIIFLDLKCYCKVGE